MGCIVSDLPDLLPVPTVQDLVHGGLATSIMRNKQGITTAAYVTPEGHRLMGEALMENGYRMREYDAEQTRRTPPPAPAPILPAADPWPAWE